MILKQHAKYSNKQSMKPEWPMKSNFQDFQCGKCKEANFMYVGFELIIEPFDRKEKYQLLITTNKAQARLPFTDNLSQEIVRRQAQILP